MSRAEHGDHSGDSDNPDPETVLRENRERLERLANSDLPIAEDARRALSRLDEE